MADDTKQRLILATISCIERKGLHAVTSRDIAKEADANVAALNYHFGSKAKLVELALRLTVDNGMHELRSALLDARKPFVDRLHSFFVVVLAGGAEFPNLTRAHIYSTVVEGGAPGLFLRRLSDLVNEALDGVPDVDLALSRVETARRLELGLRAALLYTIGSEMLRVTPSGLSGVQEEASRLSVFVCPQQ